MSTTALYRELVYFGTLNFTVKHNTIGDLFGESFPLVRSGRKAIFACETARTLWTFAGTCHRPQPYSVDLREYMSIYFSLYARLVLASQHLPNHHISQVFAFPLGITISHFVGAERCSLSCWVAPWCACTDFGQGYHSLTIGWAIFRAIDNQDIAVLQH